MNYFASLTDQWFRGLWDAWNRFWFKPEQPHTLAMIRILGGAMLLYTQIIWTINQGMFLGPDSWLDRQTAQLLNTMPDGHRFAWSYLYYVDSWWIITLLNVAALVVYFLLMIGYQTRIVSILALPITLAYCHRLSHATFGLDQINALIAMYLMLGDSGGVYSVDRWLRVRRGDLLPVQPFVSTNIATRLLQLHMCVIYLFGGIGKARGGTWWDGSACWYAIASQEYRSLDLTGLAHYPWFLAALTHITVFWETFYCFLIWPKLTRPLCLAIAVAVHGGIALFLGMPTFGLIMIVGNLIFLSPEFVDTIVSRKWLRGETSEETNAGAPADKATPRKRKPEMGDTVHEAGPRARNLLA
jgi:hypothetical protein